MTEIAKNFEPEPNPEPSALTNKLLESAEFQPPAASRQATKTGGDKLSFDIPYDRQKAAAFIIQLGDKANKTRDTAQNQLTRMGTEVIPQLNDVITNSKDAEVRTRAELARQVINILSWSDTADAVKLDWQKLLDKAGVFMNNQFHIVGNIPGLEEQVTGPTLDMIHNHPAAPSKEEQQIFDKLLNKLDSAKIDPAQMQAILAPMKESALTAENKPQYMDQYLKLFWVDKANDHARLYYAQILAASKNTDAQDKGGKVLIEYMHKANIKIDDRNGVNIISAAIKLGIDNKPAFLAAFNAKGGSMKELERLRKLMKPSVAPN